MQLLYNIFAQLARLIFWLVGQILQLIVNLSKYQFFSDGVIGEFTEKVYIILGVLMLFKLVISAIQYLLNPDTFEDKNKGLGSILTRTVISVALLVLVPTLFEFGVSIQETVVSELPRIIFGTTVSTAKKTDGSIDFDNIGTKISKEIVSGFLDINKGKTPTKDISNIDNPWNYTEVLLDGCDANILWNTSEFIDGSRCVYSPMWFLTLPIGIYLIFLFLSMAVDVGIRTIKLGIVQILAPIPIANYITDEKKLSSWAQMTLQIYADLFIRMGIIYFVVYFILLFINSFLTDVGIPKFEGTVWEVLFVKVAVIIALLLFAKNAPKFICDLLGIKGADESIGNMFKRAGGMLGTGIAAARTAKSNYLTRKGEAANLGKTSKQQLIAGLKSAAAGISSATGRGLLASARGKGFNDIRKDAFKGAVDARNAHMQREARYNKDVPKYLTNGELNPEYYDYFTWRQDRKMAKLGVPTNNSAAIAANKSAKEIRSSIEAQVNNGLKKLEDYQNETITALNPRKGFGTYTDGDGNTIVANNMSIGYARSMANAEIGSYVVDDPSKVAQRRANILNVANNEVTSAQNNYARILNNLKQIQALPDTNPSKVSNLAQVEASLKRAERELEVRQDRYIQLQNDENIGKLQVTDVLRGQFSNIAHNLEKDGRFQIESKLLAENNIDARILAEDTLRLFRNNAIIDKGNDSISTEIREQLAILGQKIGYDSTNPLTMEKLIQLASPDSNGIYNISPIQLSVMKEIGEMLDGASSKVAKMAKDREEKAEQAAKDGK